MYHQSSIYATVSKVCYSNLNWIGTQATMDSASSPIGQLATRAAQQGWNTVFSLNEPDLSGISPSTAANWYIQYINPLAISTCFLYLIIPQHNNVPYLSSEKAIPSVSSSGAAGQGLDWAAAFISACGGRVSFRFYLSEFT